jgi:thiamine biosynthesis lipoprotein
VLRQRGIDRALVAAGGDIVVSDAPPDAKGWNIGVTPLGDEAKSSPTLSLHRCAISTSGDAEQFAEIGGTRYSHIVDPRNGMALTERIQVSVIAPDGTTADALATGLSVLGPERGLPIVERLPGVAAWFVWKKNDARDERRSKGFPEFIR